MPRMKKTTGELNGKTLPALEVAGCKLFMPSTDLDEVMYSSYAKKLEYGTTNKGTWLETFIDTNLDKLKQNLAKDPTTALSAMREMGKVVKDTQDFYNRRKATDTDFSRYLLRDKLFPYQQAVYDDISKKKTMLWGRRAGKTHTACRLALKAALETEEKPREIIIMGLTLEKTAGLYWEQLKNACLDAHINTSRIDNGSYTIILSNGNSIQLWGNNSKAEREKLRGKDTYMFIIDEMQSQQGLYYLLTDIVGPIVKGRGGEIVCLGTAPISAGTKWEEILNDDNWAHSSATMEDNPTIPNHEHALEEVLNENHWTRDNITFRREYLGEIAYDTERMILASRKYYKEIPKTFKPVCCYVGVDYGWSDFSSFAPILIDAQGQGYLAYQWKQNKTSSQVLVDKMKALVETIHTKWNIPNEDIHVVADSSHQQISQDIYNMGVTNIQNAYKLEENYQWARLGESLSTGELLIEEGSDFDKECDALVWQWNSEKGCVIYKIDEDVFHPDIADSAKYAWNTYLTDKNKN